ncbi:MAG: GAF domain-containing sensor histidine kinase [Deltaproteobacteria bacterium]|nr:GAF domain-containing sensor histidine kinase [Deltaproteobacteria bacterium]
MRDRWLQQPWSPYQDFILRTEEGQRRERIWISHLLDALGGNKEGFLRDQHRIGYARAVKGLRLENVMKNITIFMEAFWEILPEALEKKELQPLNLFAEMQELTTLLFEDHKIIAASYVKTREEIINEKVLQLQALFDFTQEIITFSELGNVVNLLLSKTVTLFGVEEVYLALYQDRNIYKFFCNPKKGRADGIRPIIEATWNEGVPLFIDEEDTIYRDINLFKLKRIVAVPIRIYERCHGVIALSNSTRGFRFTKKELDFLYHFIHILAVALENIYMLEEIEQNRKELRSLNIKMTSIQEEERKRLAGDIHDTIAQALIGISYKIQFCKELFKKKPELLLDMFDGLVETVNGTVDQSRDLISSLRPDLIDTMGLVPALKRYFDNFHKEKGIRVTSHFPKHMQFSSEVSLCLFRVAQEALMNVYKHAETKTAEVTLKIEDGNIILMVSDNGKGFDISKSSPWKMIQNKFGLLSMKERIEAEGGSLFIHSGINQGCRIEAKIPLEAAVSHNA